MTSLRAAWKNLFDEAAALPELPEMTPLVTDFTPGNNDLYELSVPTLNGKMIYDYLSIPKTPGKYPIIVGYPGTGAAAGIRPQYIYPDAISLFMEVHTYRVIPNESIARAGWCNNPLAYSAHGVESRDTFFYRMDMHHECRDSWTEGVQALHDHLTGKK